MWKITSSNIREIQILLDSESFKVFLKSKLIDKINFYLYDSDSNMERYAFE